VVTFTISEPSIAQKTHTVLSLDCGNRSLASWTLVVTIRSAPGLQHGCMKTCFYLKGKGGQMHSLLTQQTTSTWVDSWPLVDCSWPQVPPRKDLKDTKGILNWDHGWEYDERQGASHEGDGLAVEHNGKWRKGKKRRVRKIERAWVLS
jgi:hypothetical protein